MSAPERLANIQHRRERGTTPRPEDVDVLLEALAEERTRHHALRWSLGLESHVGEERPSREESHQQLDGLLDARDWLLAYLDGAQA